MRKILNLDLEHPLSPLSMLEHYFNVENTKLHLQLASSTLRSGGRGFSQTILSRIV